jgi:hypothetical protein
MPCEVVPLSVDFLKMAAVAMETAKMLKHWSDHILRSYHILLLLLLLFKQQNNGDIIWNILLRISV